MKKKFLECDRHGLTLHRCKRKYWHPTKDKYTTEYTERCFKCIAEGRYDHIVKEKPKKKQFISLRE